jgi:beta-phosphoglucomutase-like phosphatase (HAD superfamily)
VRPLEKLAEPNVPAAGKAQRLTRVARSRQLDTLAAQWWTAFDAAQSGLRAAGLYLRGGELGERSDGLSAERSQTVQLLQGLARDLHSDSRLLRLFASPAVTRRMLGLPSGVIACVFDLDGVLTTSASVHAAAWTETFDSFLLDRAERGGREFIPFDPRRDYEDHIAGRPRLNGVRAFLASRGISLPEGRADDPAGAPTVHGIANRKNQAMQQRLHRQGVAAFDASRCYLEASRMVGVHRAVVSASANTGTILERAGLAHLIEQRIDGTTIEAHQLRSKPAPDTLLAACQALHLEPGQTAAFETTPAGITAARAAGIKFVIGVDRSGYTEALRASDADLVVSDLAELLDRDSPQRDAAQV